MRSIVEDILEWDIRAWLPALRFWDSCLDGVQPGLALEIGAHNGGLSLYLARKGYQVVCSDLEWPSECAAALHRKHAVSEQITYRALDVTRLELPDGSFDVVCFKSVLGGVGSGGHFERQEKAIAEMHRVLRPGGKLLFAENLTGGPLHRFAREHFVEWGRRWRYLTCEEIEKLLTGFSCVQMFSCGCLSAFGRSEWQRTTLHWIDVLLSPLLPRSWRYICVACATK